MKSNKQNCWEFMQCGRQPGGENSRKHGICPAASDTTFNNFNQGINAGRACWLVAGTFCGGKVQGTFAEKQLSCKRCRFYQKVHAEEGDTLQSVDNLNIFAATHIGRVRKANQDRYLIKKLGDGAILLAVADGLGGEAAGDYAAEIARSKMAGISQVPRGEEERQFEALVKSADLAVYNEALKDPDLEGMGTTLVCVLLRDGLAHWAHVGDSRLYILRERKLIKVTEDQTFARFLVEEGEITPEQVPTHYSRHVLDQTVGCSICEPETGSLEFKEKDLLILTTDGLHDKIAADEMISILAAETDLETKARSLIEAALDAGGKDNITIVVADAGRSSGQNVK
jgi:serine/threonine protein phosphatase PrpC